MSGGYGYFLANKTAKEINPVLKGGTLKECQISGVINYSSNPNRS